MHQLIERFQQAGLLVDQRPIATARCSQPSRRLDTRDDLTLGLDHRVATHPRRGRDRGLATPSQHLRRRPGHHPPLQLIHVRHDHLEESRESLRCDLHTLTILRAD
jgi:hypothetical protein